MEDKKAMLKAMVKSCKDGTGGPGSKIALSATDDAIIAPYKNAYYKRAKAASAMDRILKLTGMRGGGSKYPKSRQEALDQLSGN